MLHGEAKAEDMGEGLSWEDSVGSCLLTLLVFVSATVTAVEIPNIEFIVTKENLFNKNKPI